MKSFQRPIALGIALCLVLLGSCSAFAARIAGRVVDGTTNNSPAAGLQVQIVRPGFDRAPTVVLATVKTDAAGHFDSSPPNVARDDLLTARITWQGFLYEIPAYDGAGQLRQFGVDAIRSNALELTIFDSTTTPPPLTFTVHHVAISTEDRTLKCIERIVVENPSLRTFIGEGANHVTVHLSLPAGARDVQLDPKIRSGKLVSDGDGYGVALPITPRKYDNRNAIIVNYTMTWERGGVDLSRKLLYPVRFFFMAREEKDRKLLITAPQLGVDEDQSVPIDGQPQTRIVNKKGPSSDGAAVFEAGTVVSMNVSRATNPLVWAFVAFVGALCLVVPLTLVRARTPNPPSSPSRTNPDNSLEPSGRQSVMHGNYRLEPAGEANLGTTLANPMLIPAVREFVEEIAKLDDAWEAGTIARVTYQEQRAVWKAKALKAHSAAQPEEQ